jgi:rhodanese-related sulfurtransferase/DNA-directed RNA polymerase subunit RPC12/RpoP
MKKSFAVILLVAVSFISVKCLNNGHVVSKENNEIYVCLPCGATCDTILHKSPGTCSDCNMELVKRSAIKHTNIRPQELCSFITKTGKDKVLLLDVRTPAEFEGRAEAKYGRLSNAVNIPIQELAARMKELDAWRNKQIVVYCSHSHRSPRASYMLSQNGFTKVTNMSGGMSVWGDSVKDKECNENLFISQ